jgi:hypothetical protein
MSALSGTNLIEEAIAYQLAEISVRLYGLGFLNPYLLVVSARESMLDIIDARDTPKKATVLPEEPALTKSGKARKVTRLAA